MWNCTGCPDARERAGPVFPPPCVGEEETQAQRARARRDNCTGTIYIVPVSENQNADSRYSKSQLPLVLEQKGGSDARGPRLIQ